jgi:hypothetical protein
MAVLNFAVPTSPYQGLADSLYNSYAAGVKAKQDMLSFPEQLKQLQLNTKLLETKQQYADPLAQADLTQQQVLAQYAQPNAAADLQKTQLANALAEITNRYAPRKNEADIGSTELSNQVSRIGLKTLPEMNQAALEKALLGNKEANINLQTLSDKNLADIAEAKARAQYMGMGGGKGGVVASNLGILRSAIDRQYPNATPEQKNAYYDAYLSGNYETTPDGTPIPTPYGEVQTALDAILHSTNTTMAQNQMRFAATLDTLFKNADPIAEKAFKFAGMARDAKLGIDALAAQRGASDPDYLAYLQFTDQVIPSMVSEILRTGGSNSTDSQKLLAIQETNPIQRRNNPELAMQQWKFLEDTYKKLSKTIAQSPSATRANLLSNDSNTSLSTKDNSNRGTFENPIKLIFDPVTKRVVEDKS